jgi:(2R)-3-sulfolactate dehydrogenase (NADP+)
MTMIVRSSEEWHRLAKQILVNAGANDLSAQSVADALIAAELDGIVSHGLSRLPAYADQLAAGKIKGMVQPEVQHVAPAIVKVDAKFGFAFPAIAAGINAAVPVAREMGLAALAICNSHHCGVLGYHVESMARHGLFALAFANTPAAIAPWGGTRGLFGTNPIAFACPRRDGSPLVIDVAMSVVARGKVMLAASRNEPIPEGWAFDPSGQPTTDAKKALAGTMAPIGDAKGAALAMMIELLAAALTQSRFGFEASSFFDASGQPPGVGQLFLLLDIQRFGGDTTQERIETLCQTVEQEAGARLPGARRLATREKVIRSGIAVPDGLFRALQMRAESQSAPTVVD